MSRTLNKLLVPLNKLSKALPSAELALTGEDLDVRARAVLALLVDRCRSTDLAVVQIVPADAATCPNCGAIVLSKASPYCSDCCRERAAFIRQMRDRIANGSLLEPQGQMMKGEQMWRLLGGGLPRRLSLVTESARQRVFKRSEGKCEICGAPATRIDNTGSG